MGNSPKNRVSRVGKSVDGIGRVVDKKQSREGNRHQLCGFPTVMNLFHAAGEESSLCVTS
ncbi:MAG: hypothetical protein RL441_1669, partial [Actinomycetota bacterium]